MLKSHLNRLFKVPFFDHQTILPSLADLFLTIKPEIFIKQRHIRNYHRADPKYGEGVSKELGLSLNSNLPEDM